MFAGEFSDSENSDPKAFASGDALAQDCRVCGLHFLLCRSCYRGQRYCSQVCRKEGYGRRRRTARARYDKSERGLQTHRLRSRRFRGRCAQFGPEAIFVTDPSSPAMALPVIQAATYSCSTQCSVCGLMVSRVRESIREFYQAGTQRRKRA